MPSKIIIFGFFLFFIGVVGGMVARPFLFSPFGTTKNNLQSATDVSDTANPNYQAGFNAARKLVEESGLGNFIHTEEDVRSVAGVVTVIDGNRVSIHSEPSGNPFDRSAISDRIVVADVNTKVFKLSKKDSATMDAEIAKSIKESQSNKPTFLEEYTKTTSDVSNILVGDSILVVAGENVKALPEFTAQEIQIEPEASLK